MARKIVADDAGAIMDISPIPDDRQRTANMVVKLTQKPNGVLSAGVGIIAQQCDEQIETLLLGTDRDRANGRNSVVPVPRLEDRCFTARGIRPPHGGIEHVAGFVEEYQCGSSGLGLFFLSAGILPASSVRFRPRRVPLPDTQAFDCSSVGVSLRSSAHGRDGTELGKAAGSDRPRAWKSTIRWANRELLHPARERIPIHEVDFHSSAEGHRDVGRLSNRPVRSAPSYASGRAIRDQRREFQRSLYVIDRCSSIQPRGYDDARVLQPCREVSCS